MGFLNKFIDLLDRRVLQGGQIPHEEKVFSIIEEYTEWITKGKLSPNVELGKKLSITEEHRGFKLLRNRHSAVESNINELEHRGLDRCPDRGYGHFKRYVGLAVASYNLRRIGQELIAIQRNIQQVELEYSTASQVPLTYVFDSSYGRDMSKSLAVGLLCLFLLNVFLP